MTDYTQKAIELFRDDRFAMDAGVEIVSAEPGHAICRMEVTPRHLNANNAVMGGAVFTLADLAFAAAANIGGTLTVTQSSQITYLRAARGKTLTAEAECIRDGRTTCFYVIRVNDELGTEVAYVTATGIKA